MSFGCFGVCCFGFFFFLFSLSHFFESWILHPDWNKIYPAFRRVWIKHSLACVLCLYHLHCCPAALPSAGFQLEVNDFTSQACLVLGEGQEWGRGDMKSWLSSLQWFPLLSSASFAVIIQREILAAWETSQQVFYMQRSCSSQCCWQPTHCTITFRRQHKLQWMNFSGSTDGTLGDWVTERKIYKQKQALAVKETHSVWMALL